VLTAASTNFLLKDTVLLLESLTHKTMMPLILLLGTLGLFVQESSGQIVLTQSPAQIVLPGSSVSISCTACSSVTSGSIYVHRYLQKPGQAPQLLVVKIYIQYIQTPQVSEQFTGSGSVTAFTLTITGVQAEDAGDYYCQQSYHSPLT
uniref:Immunoglobulin light 3 variable 4 n=1 Tax=Lepisosteus oculatus TaxID=7918 RepID=W5LVX2_LEPOC